MAVEITAVPKWARVEVDRRNFRYSTSHRFPLSGPNAVTPANREKNLVKESAATNAAMSQAPENTIKPLKSFNKASVLPWLTKLEAYYIAGGTRAIINLLSQECSDEISTTIISSANPVLRDVASMDEREVVHIITNFFRSAKASDLAPLESAFASIAMKPSVTFTPEPLATYLGKCFRILEDNAASIPSYAVEKIVGLMVQHLAPKEFCAAVKLKMKGYKSTDACFAGIRNAGLLFEDHSNVQKQFYSPVPSKVPPPETPPPTLPTDKNTKNRERKPEIV